MANTRELRRRIKSVKNISQITKAMQMVAATKMRKAQNQALSGRPYNLALNFSLHNLLPKIQDLTHPLMQENEAKSSGVVLLSTDKSLCGALNTNLFRALGNFGKDNSNLVFFTVGKKGREFLVRTGKNLEADFENPEVVAFREAKQISRMVIKSFLEKEVKEVYLAFPDFVSTLRQEPKITKLLPLSIDVIISDQNQRGDLVNGEIATSSTNRKTPRNDKKDDNAQLLIEPNPEQLLEELLLHFVETKIYQALLETKASEHSARMMAMQNATDNAKDLASDLNLTYNQTRQDAITRELLEITTAGAAME